MNIRAYWRAVIEQDAAAIAPFFAGDALIRWHASNECFTPAEFIRANCEYPGKWACEIERIDPAGESIVTAVRVYGLDSDVSCHVVSFFRIQDGKILLLDEYWGDDGPPPLWRQEMGIGRKIRE